MGYDGGCSEHSVPAPRKAGATQVPTAGIGTPVAREGLIFNVARTNGGVVLTLTAASGKPVTDASVTLAVEMLEMTMGAHRQGEPESARRLRRDVALHQVGNLARHRPGDPPRRENDVVCVFDPGDRVTTRS
jgi:hypothetical protein